MFGFKLISERNVDTLLKKVTIEVPHSLNIGALRKEHQRLCETVAMANKVFAPFLLVIISLNIPLLCVEFNQLEISSSSNKEKNTYIIIVMHRCVIVTAKLAVILSFGVKLNEKASFQIGCI